MITNKYITIYRIITKLYNSKSIEKFSWKTKNFLLLLRTTFVFIPGLVKILWTFY